MKYVQITTLDPVIDHAVNTLCEHLLSGERIVWLLSGGSAIDLEVRVAQALQTIDVSYLTVGLVDERYGPIGHKDENYVQLMLAHFPLYIHRVLQGASGRQTAKNHGAAIEKALQSADFSLGILSIGTDGHTAGIKPKSPAVTSTESAIFYAWDDHERITLTPPTILKLDETIVYAVGPDKVEALEMLVQKDVTTNTQPAQLLKGVKVSTLYTDSRLNGTQ